MFAKDRRRRGARMLRMALWGLAVGRVLEALVLRRRREQIRALPEPPKGSVATGEAGKTGVLSATGAHVDEATLAAAWADMEASGARVVDLVPGDISAERALALLWRLDPERLGRDPVYSPGGAHEAVILDPDVAQRMGVPEEGESLERGALMRRTVDAQRHAPANSAVRLAPDLKATPVSPRDRWHELEEGGAYLRPHISLAPTLLGLETAWLAAVTAGLFMTPLAAAAALAAWSAQPLLVFSGGARPGERSLTPPDVVTSGLSRFPQAWVDHVRTVLVAYRETRAARARRLAAPLPAPPTNEELFDEPRSTCPWCGSAALVGMFDRPDIWQHKSVTTHLDKCSACGHIFQNPQLTPTGLGYIYSDFYDGATAELAQWQFGDLTEAYEARARSVKQFINPKAWLDVGTCYGHFCLAARKELPDTAFDGLDMNETVEIGQRRGWMDTAYRGSFADLAGSLPRYDVLSMHHYLEHTKDPRAEIATAARVLEPGTYLEIEVPDPESPWGRWLGQYWYQWAQPQHLNFITCDNMVAELETQGFDVVSVQRGPSGMGGDLVGLVVTGIQSASRSPHAPWSPPPSLPGRLKRAGVLTVALPAMIAAWVGDRFQAAWMKRRPDEAGNGYRVVARRREEASLTAGDPGTAEPA